MLTDAAAAAIGQVQQHALTRGLQGASGLLSLRVNGLSVCVLQSC